MASVESVYFALKDLANKDQRGFITPSTFNRFSQVAQLNIFNSLFVDARKDKVARLRNIEGARSLGTKKQIKEDLSFFSKEAVLSQSEGVFAKPDDLARIISLRTNGKFMFGQSNSTNIDIVYDEEKLYYILNSTLSVPTESRPVAVLGDDVEVFPTSIKKVKLRYYKYPEGKLATTGARTASTPRFAYTVSNGVESYSAANSVDFELPAHYEAELITEMAKLIGVNLRDSDVYNYATTEQQRKITE
jgi:hypothetical protein|tara:strand:+ start:382 stop:1122 length:741 start_codon:yes stop_codon:yes gene_type:complete